MKFTRTSRFEPPLVSPGGRPARRLPVEFHLARTPVPVAIKINRAATPTHEPLHKLLSAFGRDAFHGVPFCSVIARDIPTTLTFGFHFSQRLGQTLRVRRLFLMLLGCWFATCLANAQSTNSLSIVIEAAGQVEFFGGEKTNWQTAAVGLLLHPGDRVRTREHSRAAIQLSDRSVIRLNERTTLEILPPRRAEKKRFGLPAGSLYFFNREKPADVEFDTPLAAGAIRGTEFLLEVVAAGGTPAATSFHLALIDGLVSLKTTDNTEINLQRGEELQLAPGQPPLKTALVNATAKIQWALYYPAVVNPAELQLGAGEQSDLAAVLKKYQEGDLLGALAAWPATLADGGSGQKILRAQLELAVGRVSEAEKLLAGLPENPAASALLELIAVVRNDAAERRSPTRLAARSETSRFGDRRSASELLAHSYALQARADLNNARAAARRATELAPDFGFAHARLAELEFAFGNRRAALAALDWSLSFSPRLAAAHALQGFVWLDQGKVKSARPSFNRACELDAALGSAWLGRGLCLLRERNFGEARAAFQAAAALEPQRSLFRSYLGKAASELGDSKAADKEFRLAKELDANDPTAWLYSALHLWHANQLNAAIRDLETSSDKNDNRAAFRSRELLDGDRSVRSANLAAIYDDAGLNEVSRHVAARSVSESYANFSGHLFLADSYQSLADANRFDLRLETARQSELLVANLLAPPGAGNLSQVLSQSERLRFFDQKPVGVSSLASYGSRGDWSETATVFGSVKGFSYAFDAAYQSLNGQRVNNDREQRDFVLTLKQRVTADDEAYFQIGTLHSHVGDVAGLYDPATATPGLQVEEQREPDIYVGWHHAWSPGSHTLLLLSRLEDKFFLRDPQSDQIFLFQSGGVTQAIQSPPLGPPFTNDFSSGFTLYSAELQQIFETPHHSLILGGRWQSGDVDSAAILSRDLTGVVTAQTGQGDFTRGSAYGYYSWRPFDALSLIGGVTYDHLEFPENTDLTPISFREVSHNKVSPKAGILFTPWKRGLLRASYTRSLGGLFFDNSVRLEPTQVGGFNQAFRSLIPESAAGLLPGAAFETANVGFDQSLASGTFFGVEAGWLTSDGSRTVGVLTNSFFFPVPDSPGRARQQLDFRERNLSAYAAQLLGDYFSASARYRLSEAKLTGEFPDLPDAAAGLSQLEQKNRAVLHQVSLALNFNHPSGVFAQWESSWYHQDNFGYTPALPDADFWQHNLMVGYRFPRRHAELRAGVVNLLDTDYRLNPLNLHAELPRTRMFVGSLRLNF